MSDADFFALGDWNAQCFRCGRKFKASLMRKTWEGFYTCPRCWEPRQPQDYVRGVPDKPSPEWTQPQPADDFVEFCTPNGISAVPDYAQPDCCVPDLVTPAAIGPFV